MEWQPGDQVRRGGFVLSDPHRQPAEHRRRHAEQGVADLLPMRAGQIRVAGRPEQRRRQENPNDDRRANEDDHGENQQLFIAPNHREGTLYQMPATLKPIHFSPNFNR